ncbi:hypothetical protein K474DRAFT_1597161, partial [Panus rudis PR-1116 ss-1]
YTPTKRVRLMTAALASTASGSFLVSKKLCTSADKPPAIVLEGPPDIPEPDWSLTQRNRSRVHVMTRGELETDHLKALDTIDLAKQHMQARDGIIEGAQSQLVVQDIYAYKINEALYTKETKQQPDRTQLFVEGKGRYATEPQFAEQVKRAQREREEEEGAKLQRRVQRLEKREAREAAEAAWTEIKKDHAVAVAAWQEECERLLREGKPKSSLPKKPARQRKPRAEDYQVQGDVDEYSDEEE